MKTEIYNHQDKLIPGKTLSLLHTVVCDDDISGLVSIPVETLKSMYEDSVEKEKTLFATLHETALCEWEEAAAQTQMILHAIEYSRAAKRIKHTANQWVVDEYKAHVRSNMVYIMQYRIDEDTRYDSEARTNVPIAWRVSWSIMPQSPSGEPCKQALDGQYRKKFSSRPDAEKYIQGRVRAYEHLFTEISPPIPEGLTKFFTVSDVLLPGYSLKGQEVAQ